jgi:hypothetical protein
MPCTVVRLHVFPEYCSSHAILKGQQVQFSQISALMRRRSDLLLSGETTLLAGAFSYPLPVFLRSGRIVVQDKDDAGTLLNLVRNSLADRALARITPTVRAVDIPRGGRFRAWVDWQGRGPQGLDTPLGSMICYLAPGQSGPRIEMISCPRLSMPDLVPRLAALARCA